MTITRLSPQARVPFGELVPTHPCPSTETPALAAVQAYDESATSANLGGEMLLDVLRISLCQWVPDFPVLDSLRPSTLRLCRPAVQPQVEQDYPEMDTCM